MILIKGRTCLFFLAISVVKHYLSWGVVHQPVGPFALLPWLFQSETREFKLAKLLKVLQIVNLLGCIENHRVYLLFVQLILLSLPLILDRLFKLLVFNAYGLDRRLADRVRGDTAGNAGGVGQKLIAFDVSVAELLPRGNILFGVVFPQDKDIIAQLLRYYSLLFYFFIFLNQLPRQGILEVGLTLLLSMQVDNMNQLIELEVLRPPLNLILPHLETILQLYLSIPYLIPLKHPFDMHLDLVEGEDLEIPFSESPISLIHFFDILKYLEAGRVFLLVAVGVPLQQVHQPIDVLTMVQIRLAFLVSLVRTIESRSGLFSKVIAVFRGSVLMVFFVFVLSIFDDVKVSVISVGTDCFFLARLVLHLLHGLLYLIIIQKMAALIIWREKAMKIKGWKEDKG